MSIIYQTDPEAPAKLRMRLEALERELRIIQEQDRMAKATGHPKNPPRIADSLRSRIRQTRKRLEGLGHTIREERPRQ